MSTTFFPPPGGGPPPNIGQKKKTPLGGKTSRGGVFKTRYFKNNLPISFFSIYFLGPFPKKKTSLWGGLKKTGGKKGGGTKTSGGGGNFFFLFPILGANNCPLQKMPRFLFGEKNPFVGPLGFGGVIPPRPQGPPNPFPTIFFSLIGKKKNFFFSPYCFLGAFLFFFFGAPLDIKTFQD